MTTEQAQRSKRDRGSRRARDRALGEIAVGSADFEQLKALMDQQSPTRDGGRSWTPVGAGLVVLGVIGLFVAAPRAEVLPWEADLALEEPEVQRTEVAVAEATLEPEPTNEPTPRPPAVLPASVARAAAVVFSSGRQVGRGGHYDVRFSRETRAALRSVGISVPRRSSSAAAREAALVRGLGRLVEELGSLEAGIGCLTVERELIESALDLAFGAGLPEPDRLGSFGRYLPPEARERTEGPTRRVMALAVGYDMQWPVPEAARVSSGFGARIHPVLGEAMWHTGTDLAVEKGTPIRAMADGEVLYSKRDAVNGKFVKLDHGYGLTSAYVHNSKLLVGEGQRVKRGQVIALSGATGRATGPHLHFQVEIDDRPIDPENFRERKAPRAHRRSVEAEAIGDARIPH